MSEVSYKLGKVYYIEHKDDKIVDCEKIVVHAETAEGGYAYTYEDNPDTKRDYKNMENVLSEIDDFIAQHIRKVSFKADETPADARKKIAKYTYENKHMAKIDDAVSADIHAQVMHDYNTQNAEYYAQALMALSKLEPAGVYAILTESNYPFTLAARDFARGVSYKQIRENIKKLPRDIVTRLLSFAVQRNYILSAEACKVEGANFKAEVARSYPKIDRSTERMDTVLGRAVAELLHDALAYKYYKRTGNMEIFADGAAKRYIDQMSDVDLVKFVGWKVMQNYGYALFVIQRMEKIIASNRDITPLITELNKTLGDGYVNQDIMRIMYNTLAPHYNKFKQNKKVSEFVGRLRNYVKDERFAKQMAETFGLPDAPKPNKEKVRARLKDAAARIESGDAYSGVVILDLKNYLQENLAVVPTSQTYDRIKKNVSPADVQKKIMQQYGKKQK